MKGKSRGFVIAIIQGILLKRRIVLSEGGHHVFKPGSGHDVRCHWFSSNHVVVKRKVSFLRRNGETTQPQQFNTPATWWRKNLRRAA
ncbi:MAG: hypothetical protein ACI9QL_002087 [Candidatus Omnitrophota bacterium]|jgi:hypothetical protein